MITESKPENYESKKFQKNNRRIISLWLDSYDDLFSDFDPRPFSDRNISDDFLYEVKKVSSENDFFIQELKLLLPQKSRDTEIENIITKRLHSFFTRKHHHVLKKKKTENKKAFLFIFIGVSLMVCASFLSAIKSENLLMHALLVIVEPAGWFLVWTGMDNLINTSRREKPEIDFYSKLSKSKIVFKNIDI